MKGNADGQAQDAGGTPTARTGATSAWLRFVSSAGSGLLLALAFPPVAQSQFGWFALTPLLLVLRFTPPLRAFRWGFLSGLSFWLVSLAWLLRLGHTGPPWPVAALGWLLLCACCSVYTGAFAVVASALFRLCGHSREAAPVPSDGLADAAPAAPAASSEPSLTVCFTPGPPRAGAGGPTAIANIGLLGAIPLAWVGFEYLRGTLLSGFPWNPLGVSQYQNLPIIQVAEWGGAYAVSGLLMIMNTALALMLLRARDISLRRATAHIQIEILAALAVVALCWFGGLRKISAVSTPRDSDTVVNVAAIQPNIAQLKKWPAEFTREIYQRLEGCMELALLSKDQLDLIVWPETALPSFLPEDAECLAFVQGLAREGGVPLLVGAMEAQQGGPDKPDTLYNSAHLFDGQGNQIGLYRKNHLVPFGEYLPLDKRVPLIARCAPLGFSCTPGSEMTVFRIRLADRAAAEDTAGGASGLAPAARPRGKTVSFSALICFEDAFAPLARRAVRRGARLLINQTNDAWFDGTSAAVQHMAQTVFRCVENRVPAVRAANTGVTCFIDTAGRIDETTRQMIRQKAWDQIQYRLGQVRAPSPDRPPTLYTRYGDWPFAAPCGLFAAAGLALVVRAERRARRGRGL